MKQSSRDSRGNGRRPLQSRSAENLTSCRAGLAGGLELTGGVGRSRSAQELYADSERRDLYSSSRYTGPADSGTRQGSCRYGSRRPASHVYAAGERQRSSSREPLDRALSTEEREYAVEHMHEEFCRRRKGVLNGFPTGCTEEEVDAFLERYFCKTVSIIKDRSVRILFQSPEVASDQLQRLSSLRYEGCKLSAAYGHPDSLLFVGNLSSAFTHRDLLRLFQPHGDILRCFVVASPSTGLSKCYGFVEFSTRDEAAQAKLQLATKVVGQRSLRVDFADNGMQTCEDLQSRTLFVDRLPKGFAEDNVLRDKFSMYGIVNFCQVALTSGSVSRGFAFIDMSTWQEAESAQASCSGATLAGHEMRVSFGMPCRPGACILQHKNTISIPFIAGRPIGSTLHLCQKENIHNAPQLMGDFAAPPPPSLQLSVPPVYKPRPLQLDVNRPEFVPNPSFVPCGSLSSLSSSCSKIGHSSSAPDITSHLPSLPPPSQDQPISTTPSAILFTTTSTESLTSQQQEPPLERVSRKRCASSLDTAVDEGLMAVYDRPYIGQHQQGIPFTHPLKRMKTSENIYYYF